MRILIEDLSYTYARGTPLARTALRQVSLEIAPGERVGILGGTGSGKSTLAQLIAGLLAPTTGTVSLNGTRAHARGAAARACRRRIGIAFQYPEDQVFEPTVIREVTFGLRHRGYSGTETSSQAHRALEMVGLDPGTFADRPPLTLSGGEMRRVALASVLALRPEVLILDEPTAGLDPAGRNQILTSVQAWQEETNTTLILISHHLDELACVAERVIILREGTLIADGPARRVLSDEALLETARLIPPATVALLLALRAAGWDVETDRLLPQQAVAEIVRAWEGRR